MGRPVKNGLDYFPLDNVMDDKVKLIEAKFGLVGFGVLIKLYQKIYTNGYFTKFDEDHALLFSKEIDIPLCDIQTILQECFKRDLFDEEMFNKFKILTSRGIQKTYKEIVKRRLNIELIKDYIYDDINFENTNINFINTDGGTQSKVKESKVNKSKVNIEYPDWLNLELWESFKLHRKELKKSLSIQAEKLNLTELKKLIDQGYDQADVINQSIAQGWKGLFPVKKQNTKPQTEDFSKYEYIGTDISKISWLKK